jgi:hypothetical protein
LGLETPADKQPVSQPLSNEGMVDSVLHNISPLEFLKGCYHGAVQKPVDAIKQLCGSKVEKAKDESTFAGKAGEFVGEVVDFTILSAATRGALKPVMGAAVDGAAGTATKMFAVGAIDGGLLTTSDDRNGLLRGRLGSALIAGSSFAVMGGMKRALDASQSFGSTGFLKRSFNSAIAGSLGGLVSANETSVINDRRLATTVENLSAAGKYALFSVGMDALQVGAQKGLERMRSPETLRPALTTENNPITAFDKNYSAFVANVRAVDAEGTTGNTAFYALARAKGDFVEKLLGVWHGTADSPGMAAYTDAELAAASPPGAGYSIERIAQIRDALTTPVEASLPDEPSAFDRKMAKLAPVEISGEPEKYGLYAGLDTGAQRFFGFDSNALNQKLGLDETNEAINRHGGTPLDWMPFEPSTNLSNLFHATNSRAIAPILEEGALIPGAEVRLKGVQQTGESVNREIPHSQISMTRSFPTAFTYHRAGSAHLTDYPVVFGISRDVMSKAQSASLAEPGEFLIDRLKLGSSWREWLGLRKPDVTHIFVPDNQVPTIEQSVRSSRLSGLRVVGFSDIDAPRWNDPQPMVNELTHGFGFF